MLAVVLLLLGGGLRVMHATQPPFDHGAMRQYWSALQARDHERVLGGNASGFSTEVIRKAAENEIEPPILQWVTGIEWRASGTESFWVPQVIAIAAWTIGGWFVFLLLRRIRSELAGLGGVAVWSFLPFSIYISRSFLPDVPMVACIAAAAYFMVRADDDPSTRNEWLAVGVGALAVFVKLPAIFFVLALYAGLEVHRRGIGRLISKRTIRFSALIVLPTLVYYVIGLSIGGWLRGQDGGRIQPDLLLTVGFWKSWAQLDRQNFGPVILLLGVAGLLTARGRSLWAAASLAVGYMAFGLVFTFHYMTHTYYHLGAVLVLSVAIGLLTDQVFECLRRRMRAAAAYTLLGAVSALAFVGALTSWFPFIPPAASAASISSYRRVPERVGALVDHSSNVVWVAPIVGVALRYYGGVAGTDWETIRPHYASNRAALRQIRAKYGADYFVIVDPPRGAQPNRALENFLAAFPEKARGPGFVIYDLRGQMI